MNRFARVLARNVAPVFRRGSVHAVQQVSRRSLHSSLLGIVRTRFPAPVFSQQPQFVRFFSDEDEVINVMVPGMGDSIEEGTIVEWVKGPGDWVRVDDIIVLVETDKVVVEIRAEHEGQILNVHAEVDDSVDVGAPLLDLAPGDVPEGEGGADAGNTTPDDNNAPAPAANDQSAKTEEKPPAEKPAPPAPAAAPAAPDAAAEEPAGDRIEERVKMSRMRKTIAKNLKHAQNTAALLTSFQEVDMSALIEMRKKHKDAFEAKFGTKLGFMSPFMKACGLALQEVPAVNSQLDEDENIVYRNYSDISVAVATPTGLVMPVVRNCHSQSLAGMESDLNDLAARARTREISMEEMQGGTFSISNGGIFGSLMGTPILFAPQTAILGMHGTKMRAVVDPSTGEVVARPMMYLALTYDHRLIDGREAVTFLVSVRDKIEDPHRMLLGL